jgi:hypothetical protein
MWNINQHQHWTNNAVKGLNSKLNSIIGKQQPNVFLQVQKLKEEAEYVSLQLISRNLDSLVNNNERLSIKKKKKKMNCIIMQ